MDRTIIKNVIPGSYVKLQGFVDTCRNKKSIAFIVLRDITGKIQVTVDKNNSPQLTEVVDKITRDSVIAVEGKVVENSYVKLNGIEVLAEEIEIESLAEPLPIDENSFPELKMDYRWVELRSEKNQLIFKVQTLIANSMRQFLIENNFIEIHTPKLIGAASESGAEVFALDYFGSKAYLAQSPQFYKQMAMASGFERIFEVGPVFRAEKSNTNKHTTEFTGFDLEMSYIDSYRDIMQIEQDMLTYMLEQVKAKYGNDIKRLYDVDIVVPEKPFPVMKLADVYSELDNRYGYRIDVSEQGDLSTEAERLCKKLAKDMYDSEFLFITEYSAEKRAFYHMRDTNGVPLGYDLIWKGVEITTGAQREHRYDILAKQAKEKGLGEDIKHYMEFFRYGCPPHGGFGIGLDRITMMLFNLTIKDVMFLFRGPSRLTP
jgi:aspartyl-tRNA synthetase